MPEEICKCLNFTVTFPNGDEIGMHIQPEAGYNEKTVDAALAVIKMQVLNKLKGLSDGEQ